MDKKLKTLNQTDKHDSRKRLSILGSTGSIGTQTLEVVDEFPDAFDVVALTCDSNTDRLARQVEKYHPERVCITNPDKAAAFQKEFGKRLGVEVLTGTEGLVQAASEGCDTVLTAVSGMIGLEPTLAAARNNVDIALANKETLVAGGSLVTAAVEESASRLLPVDSEHSAIFQSLYGNSHDAVKRIIITASGGPFLHYSKEELAKVTPAMALKHPNWNMGAKITIDSSTLMNKGLEVIEARWLFDLDPDQIDVVVHPESVIHSMVEYQDHSVIGQMGLPDMTLPIQIALFYPERIANNRDSLDFAALGRMTFEKPDRGRFPSLAYAEEALRTGGTMPAILNAANEVTAIRFLNGEISWPDIASINRRVMKSFDREIRQQPTLADILEASEEARRRAVV
ncbi:MAG: 1-deoxy-D-xylulose-5-phosphate reductoisomerase [Eubacteriaceae bacterium]